MGDRVKEMKMTNNTTRETDVCTERQMNKQKLQHGQIQTELKRQKNM